MDEKFTRFDIADFIRTPSDMWHYLNAVKEEDLGDGRLIRLASRDVKHTIRKRLRTDPLFAQAFRIEVATLFHNDEPEMASRMLYLLNQALRHQTTRRVFYLSALIRLNSRA